MPQLSLAVGGSPALFTTGRCLAGWSTFYSGPHAAYYLDLGAVVPLGGTLTVTTCGASAGNTVLYVGLGCPTSDDNFRCRMGNDNAADAGLACAGGNALASTLLLTAITSRSYFVLLGGYGGMPITSGLSWRYTPPTVSPSPTRTRTRTPTITRSSTRTRTKTSSRTRTKKRKLLAA